MIVEIIAVPKLIEKFGQSKPRISEALSGTFTQGTGNNLEKTAVAAPAKLGAKLDSSLNLMVPDTTKPLDAKLTPRR